MMDGRTDRHEILAHSTRKAGREGSRHVKEGSKIPTSILDYIFQRDILDPISSQLVDIVCTEGYVIIGILAKLRPVE